MPCNRLNLLTMEACGALPVIDKFHMVCAIHSTERIMKHRAYHIFYEIRREFQEHKINRQEAANMMEKEPIMRQEYAKIYQLPYSSSHDAFEKKIIKEIEDMRRSALERIQWCVTSELLSSIKSNKVLNALNLTTNINWQKIEADQQEPAQFEWDAMEVEEIPTDEELSEDESVHYMSQYDEELEAYYAEAYEALPVLTPNQHQFEQMCATYSIYYDKVPQWLDLEGLEYMQDLSSRMSEKENQKRIAMAALWEVWS